MKLPDPENFNLKPCVVGGENCLLITPKEIGVKWTPENEWCRSVIVTEYGNRIVSIGFKKFCNFGENPDFQPWDDTWEFDARHKLDGSLLIISKFNGELITRTRGTTDARFLDNGHEIDQLIAKYPKLFDNEPLNSELCSILCEWTTPNNIIVLREHKEPTLTLIGMVSHDTLKYTSQATLDYLAPHWGVERPERFHYGSIKDCLMDVEAWKGKEGVVTYSPDGQTLKKCKGTEYYELHKLATGLKTIGQVLDVFMESEKFTDPKDFYRYIETTLDFEIAERIQPDMEKICAAYTKYLAQLEKVKAIVENLRYGFSRREQALEFQAHWADWRLSHAFLVLDNKEIPVKSVRNAIESLIE